MNKCDIIIISCIALCLFFIPSMVTMGLSLKITHALDNLQYGYLNLTGTTYFDANDNECVQNEEDPYVCCVRTSYYLIGLCPIISYDNFCVPVDGEHQSGQMCIYS